MGTGSSRNGSFGKRKAGKPTWPMVVQEDIYKVFSETFNNKAVIIWSSSTVSAHSASFTANVLLVVILKLNCVIVCVLLCHAVLYL